MTDTAGLLRAAQPESVAALQDVRAVAWDTPDAALLERCRRRVADLLGASTVPDDDAGADERTEAYLDFTEQFVTAVASVSDTDVDRLLAHDAPVDVYRFVAALYGLEMAMRVELVAGTVLGGGEAVTA